MDYETYLKQGLHLQGIPVDENDVPYILRTLMTVKEAEASLKEFPALMKKEIPELPITVVDKGELIHD